MAQRSGVVRRKDVADAAGVAPATVSLVLNRHPGIAIPEGTRKRIQDAARRLGYRPSHVARSLSSGQTKTIGAVIHYLSSPFQLYTAGLLNGAWPVLRERQYRLLIGQGTTEQEAGALFHDKCVDGILVLAPPTTASAGELAAMAEAHFPAVLVGASVAGDALDYVDLDNVAAARLAVRVLVEAGHRRIVHITGNLEASTAARDRLHGYKQALAEAGIRVVSRRIVRGDWSPDSGACAVEGLMRDKDGFTAVFAANDGMAHGAIQALRKAGRGVPRDVSVIGIDGFSVNPLPDVSLATIR